LVEDDEDIDDEDEPLDDNIYKDIKLEGRYAWLLHTHTLLPLPIHGWQLIYLCARVL
jgi:hypothetical protein